MVRAARSVELFDRIVRDALGIPADEFLQRWDRGEYKHEVDDIDSKLARLVGLIEFARPHPA